VIREADLIGGSGRKTLSLSTLTLIALGLGVVVGVFVGEGAGFLAPVGSAYVRLLQMAVLPYIVLSIVYGLARLAPSTARRLVGVVVMTLLVVWTIGVGASLLMPLSYPDRESATFFSRAMVERPAGLDLLDLYIPGNIFASLAESTIPAVVLFCVLLGIALMGVKKKDVLLETLGSLTDAVMRLTGLVVKTAPLGIFALAAAAAGTLRLEEFESLQVYVWGYLAMSTALAFLVLPMLIRVVTGIGFRRVFAATKDALVTGFATGSLLVVLPLLSTAIKDLLGERGVESGDSLAMVDVVVPTAFTLPSVGMLLTMSFVHFGAWLFDSPLAVSQYPAFAALSVVTAFGTWTIALPALLDAFRLPADIFNLYPLVDVITGRFSVVAAALQLVAVASIVACALSGLVRLKWLSSLRSCAIIVVVMFATVTGLKGVLSHAISHEYGGYRALVERTPLLENVKERHSEPEPLSPSQQASDRLDLIQNRGWLRVGYVEDRLPFAFRNDSGAVVGLDPELARGLAADLEVGVEFVRLSVDDAGAAVMNGSVDILMSGLVMEPSRTRFIRYSIPYMNITAALAVPDQARQEFSSLPRLTERDELRIGSFPAVRYLNGLKRYLPNVDIVPFTSPRPFFTGELDVDAVLLSAEEAAAWTLIYPRYSVAVPFGDAWGAPVAWAMDISAVSLHRFVDAWIEMAKRDGTVDRAFSYWIMGQDPPGRRVPRWSVVRNVFGWVK
jgi:Na+/H+-dicarboxylate symporter/ABC-type amino acid transport substrate-binding protein